MPDHYRQRRTNKMGPTSPAGSDGPLSLVLPHKSSSPASPPSRPKDHRIMVQHPSPHHSSSGYSEAHSSPDRSPLHRGEPSYHCPLPAHNERVTMAQHVNDPSDAPLSLVVHKSKHSYDSVGDSGHEDGSSGESSPFQGTSPHHYSEPDVKRCSPTAQEVAMKRKFSHDQETIRESIHPNVTIAKVSMDDTALDLSDSHSALGLKIKDFAKMPPIGEGEEKGRSLSTDHESSAGSSGANRKASLSSRSYGFAAAEDISDLTSEVSSIDTWTSSLADHQRPIKTINGEIFYPCDFCDKAFVNRYHLQSHTVTHTGERNFECHKCAKSFGRKSTLRAHMTTHTKTSNFMCPLCEKACNDNNSLEEHIRMHTGEKPFVCSICSKAYARKSHLNVHYRVHTGERPFVCVECGKDFTEKRFLNDHMQTAHSGQNGPLKCPNCFREFAYKTSLKQHLKKQMCVKNMNRGQGGSTHGPHAKQFQCPFCEKSYSWKQTLKQHVSMYHRNKVHTDEFWKYEMAKHRRVGLDVKANEDMWKKQLGKHAEIDGKAGGNASQRNPSVEDASHEERWLDQIHARTNSTDQIKVAAEMKSLAIQSLNNSLVYMKVGPMAAPNGPVVLVQAQAKPEVKLEPEAKKETLAPHQSQKSYIDLLAQMKASNEKSDRGNSSLQTGSTRTTSLANGPLPHLSHTALASRSPPLPDIKEEPAAKRTQMWLAQLGRYQEKSISEDMNHDELWEEQIARTKRSPNASSAGTDHPVEILLEDDASSTDSHPQVQGPFALFPHNYSYPPAAQTQVHPAPLKGQPSQTELVQITKPSLRARMIPLMSALEIQPKAGADGRIRASPPATITSECKESVVVLPKPNYPQSFQSHEDDTHLIQESDGKKLTLPLEHNIPDVLPPTPPSKEDAAEERPANVAHTPEDTPKEEEPSFLKLILLDPSARKRLNSNDYKVGPPKKKLSIESEDYNEILRRRLLGLKEQSPQPAPKKEGGYETAQPEPRTDQADQVRRLAIPAPNLHLLCPQMPTVPISNRAISKIPPTPSLSSQPTNLKVQTHPEANNNNHCLGSPKSEEAKEDGRSGAKMTSYAHTSVLKHLLHRYTESGSSQG